MISPFKYRQNLALFLLLSCLFIGCGDDGDDHPSVIDGGISDLGAPDAMSVDSGAPDALMVDAESMDITGQTP